MTSPQQSAYDLMNSTLASWGLSSLAPHVTDYVQRGYTPDTIQLYLQETPEWKQRFAGNEIRKQKGLAPLTPAQYISTEEQYRNVMRSYGLPAGFYDSHDDFNNAIGNDVSPAELSDRAKIAHDQYMNAPQAMKDTWQQYFGYGPGDAIASILDPNVGAQVMQARAAQVGIGAAAATNGFNLSAARAGDFQQHGTTLDQANKAYQFLAQNYNTDQSIADRFHTSFDQTQEENDLLLGNGQAAATRNRLYSSEQNQFKGESGLSSEAFGVSQNYNNG